MTPTGSMVRRVRAVLQPLGTVEEKKMFGALAFMVNGKMCVAVGEDSVMLRIGADAHDAATAQPECEPVVMGGRTMRGYVRVLISDLESPAAFEEWIGKAAAYNPHAPRRQR